MKIIISRIMLVFLWVSQAAFTHVSGPAQSRATSLVVNADVSIVLFSGHQIQPELSGDSVFLTEVSFEQRGTSLLITASRKKDYRTRGIIYIPAGHLEHIVINNCSKITSSTILQIPFLKLSINGECDMNIRVNGEVELLGNDSYEIDYQLKNLPASGPLVKKQDTSRLRV